MYEALVSQSKSQPRGARIALTLLAFGAVALSAAFRLACVPLGPDPDTDAYGHYMIARQLLETPQNLSIHWVWLPAYHGLLGLFAAAELTLDHVRAFNALLAAAPPLLLLWGLGRDDAAEGFGRRPVAALAAILATAAPIAMRMGTTAQMEALFSTLMLVSTLSLARERLRLAAFVLSLAVLTRYEAWAAVAGIGLVLGASAWRKRTLPPPAALACIIAPLLVVLAWAAARWLQGETWLGFLFDNQAFAQRALSRTEPGAEWLARALARYPFTMPALTFGAPAVLALAGIARTARRESIWFVAVPVSMLVFLTSGTLSRSHLGLDRHFSALVPFFALWIAHGAARVAEWGTATAMKLCSPGEGPLRLVYSASFGLLALSAIGAELARLRPSWHSWQEITRQALPAELAAGRFVASLPPSALVVCDEASIEVLSGLPAQRILRARVRPELLPELLQRAAARDTFVVSRADRIDSVATLGPVIYRDRFAGSFAVLHVRAKASADHPVAAGLEDTRP